MFKRLAVIMAMLITGVSYAIPPLETSMALTRGYRFYVRDGKFTAVPIPVPSNPVGANQVLTEAWITGNASSANTIAIAVANGSLTPASNPYTADQVLTDVWNSTYNALSVYCVSGCGGGSGSPGGSNTQVQYNSLGNFGGSANLTWVSPTLTIGVANSTGGNLTIANGSANASTTFGSAATTSNTILGFATAPVTGDLISGTVASTTTTLTDSGVLASNVVTASGTLTSSALLIGGGSKAASALADGSQYNVMVMGASNPGWGQLNLAQSAGVTGTLGTGNGGTGATTLAGADIPVFTGAITTGHCVEWASSSSIEDAGSACGSGGSGVSSLTGDENIITNSASTGAVTLSIAGTSGGVPYFSSSSAWKSSAALTEYGLIYGGGAGNAPTIVSPPSSNGFYFGGYNVTGAAATAPTATLSTSLPAGTAIGSLDTGSPSVTFGTDSITLNQPVTIGGSNGQFRLTEGSAPTGASGYDWFYAYSTDHQLYMNNNNAGGIPVVGGPTSSTSGHLATFNGTSGGLIEDGGAFSLANITATFSAPLNLSSSTLSITCSAGQVMAGATPACTATPTLGASGTAGTLALYPASGNFTTTLGTAATASNTFNFPATVFTNNHMGYCAVSSTTCTWTDTGYAYNSIPNADLANSAITIAGTSVSLGGSTSSFPSPGAIGGTTPAAITGTTITANTSLTINGGTAQTGTQGTDAKLLTAGSISGTGSTLCTDSNGGATTTGCSGGGSSALSSITAATTTNTIASGDNYGQIWNWALTTNSHNAFQFGETTAATSGTLGNQYILSAQTLAGSTAVPFNATCSLTGSQTLPCVYITPTWDTTGVVDAALLLNVTNTASGTGSKLFDFQVGGTSEGSLDKAGNANFATSMSTGTAPTITAGTSGLFACTEGTDATPVSGVDSIDCNSTGHSLQATQNDTGPFPVQVNAVTAENISSTYTALTTDYMILCNGSSAFTVDLPNAPLTGKTYVVKNTGTDGCTVTTVGGTVHIDGGTSIVMGTQYQSYNFLFDGTQYWVF